MPTKVVHPLSGQQELWRGQPGAFGPRFIVSKGLRVTGRIDVAALQGALDDVVARHEILRTVVVLDADPPHQEVHPPSPAWLVVRDVPVADGQSRDDVAEQLVYEAETGTVPTDQLPLLRTVLSRFDDRDSVLVMSTHHTACDAWSLQLVARDVAALYAARTGARPLALPEPRQYGDYVRWQLASRESEGAAESMAYWRQQLEGARIFTLPTDRPVRQVHEAPYAAYDVSIPPDVAAVVRGLGKSVRGSSFVVMLAAFNVLAHRISGSWDPVINTIVHGRNQHQFRDTVGPFLNFLALRTDLAGCASFRDVVIRTRNACLDAYDYEVPIRDVELAIPSLMAPLAEPGNCDFIFCFTESLIKTGGDEGNPFLFAEGSRNVIPSERKSEEMPGGASWTMALLPSGEIFGGLQYNPDEFDEATAAGWVTEYVRIVTAAVADPDRAWQAL